MSIQPDGSIIFYLWYFQIFYYVARHDDHNCCFCFISSHFIFSTSERERERRRLRWVLYGRVADCNTMELNLFLLPCRCAYDPLIVLILWRWSLDCFQFILHPFFTTTLASFFFTIWLQWWELLTLKKNAWNIQEIASYAHKENVFMSPQMIIKFSYCEQFKL